MHTLKTTSDSALGLHARVSSFDIADTLDDRLPTGKHVQYTINVKQQGYSYRIRKRFSDFAELHASLVASTAAKVNISLPSKTLFRCFDEDYLTERMHALNVYLAEVCRRRELNSTSALLKFLEPQLQPEWGGCSTEPVKTSIFSSVRDITKGGKRTKDTFTVVMDLINKHKEFKKEIAAMLERDAPSSEINTKTSAYLTSSAEQVRDMMLRHGGFQVKLGQAISAQKNFLPPEITQTLAACCDKAYSQPLSQIRAQVTQILGQPLEEVFASISEEPLAAASIAQVHRARLRSTGEEVIVKVVHPGVGDTMRADVAFMPYLIRLIEKVEPGHGLHPLHVTMDSMLQQELDMRREGQNRERLAAVVTRSGRSERSGHADVIFPKVHWQYCRDGMMVQEFASGTAALCSKEEVDALGVPYQLAIAELAELFGETAFVHGYLHNDLHPGNVLVRPSASRRPSSPQLKRFVLIALLMACYSAMLLAAALVLRCLCMLAPLRVWLSLAGCLLAIVGSSMFLTGDRGKAPEEKAERAPGPEDEAEEFLRGNMGRLVVLMSSGLGLHMRLRGNLERFVSSAFGDRFELVIIDHGFHTYLTFDFRRTWCKVWAAVGLVNEQLLKEAAAELNLEGDEYKVLPLILCLLPYPFWIRHQFPSPAEILELMKDEDIGLPRCKFMDKKMPHSWHLLMRVNGQVSSLFQMQYGVSPTCRYEMMRLMTRSALLGLRFKQRPIGELPVPGCLTTADCDFFDEQLPIVEEQMAAEFRWNQKFKGDNWSASGKFLSNLKKEIATEAGGGEASESGPAAPDAPSS